jgi:glucose-1-phosphate adenylyltransferase
MKSVGYCVLAGGLGSRLRPLTESLPKPLVPFGTEARIIDFTLYNCLASGGGDCLVLAQYLAHLMEDYLRSAWQPAFEAQGRRLVVSRPASSPSGCGFSGTADAVFQTISACRELPDYLVVLAGDHVYRMDYREMIDFHRSHGGWATVGAVECWRYQARRFGIMEVAGDGWIRRFYEKPRSLGGIVPPRRRPLASMGIYVFTSGALVDLLNSSPPGELSDFGKDVLPRMSAEGRAYAYRFASIGRSARYWSDIGELPSYWRANMDLLNGAGRKLRFDPFPGLDHLPFSRKNFIRSGERGGSRVRKSLVSDTARVDGATVEQTVMGPLARVERGAVVRRSVLMEGAVVRSRVHLEDAVLEPDTEVVADPAGIRVSSGRVHFPMHFRRRKKRASAS